MSKLGAEDLSNLSMLELFRLEAENQSAILTAGLLELERGAAPHSFELLMRAAHSLKGAARIVNLQTAVRLAHAMEDCFVAAQRGALGLRRQDIDLLLKGVDLLAHLSRRTEANSKAWELEHAGELSDFLGALAALQTRGTENDKATAIATSGTDANKPAPQQEPGRPAAQPPPPVLIRKPEPAERVLRLTAENLNRLLGLAGESLVESRWLRPFTESLQRLKRHHTGLAQNLEHLRQALDAEKLSEGAQTYINELFRHLADSQQFLAERTQELDSFDRRFSHLSQRMYLEVLRTRMRPFSDGARRFPRMVRDLARSLEKEVKLEVSGDSTQVDRDILERLETPLAHLLRNAVDHGCESPEARRLAGKATECVLRLDARHSAGVLLVTVSDDGAGVDFERVRGAVVQKGLTTPAVAEKLTESELLEFLFLPGFTLKETVTEISGRGFGLDVVQNMVKSVRGAIRLSNQPGRGLRVQLQLPLTLSVLRALLVEIAGEPYAFPLSQITRTLKLPLANVEVFEGRHYFQFGEQQVVLLTAHQVLECGAALSAGNELPVVVLTERNSRYGVVVDKFLGERELVVQPLDARLGKIKHVSAAALMEDGAPVLILDVEDFTRSIEKLLAEGTTAQLQRQGLVLPAPKPKRILAVDDSLTVRELERKLLTGKGYLTDVAVDGMEAWNAVRVGDYDLVITDIDMPRLDGVQLAALIKKDPKFKSLPVMIVSYKDREEDRVRGMEAGADFYLNKGSFHDESLVQAVADLIGEPV